MRITSFGLTNYRSIRETDRIPLTDMTVLIGPNNEGKSNILSGLVTGLRLLERFGRGGAPIIRQAQQSAGGARVVRPRESRLPNLTNDFHVSARGKEMSPMKFSFEFELSSVEVAEFKEEIGSSLNGKLPLDVFFDKEGKTTVEVRKQGRGGVTLGRKARSIARFVGSRVDIKDIPAIRTGRAAVSVVQDLVEEELSALESSPEYQQAVEAIAAIQDPTLSNLEVKLRDTLAKFMPSIAGVQILLTDRYLALRRDCEVLIDDGYSTSLERKGDGVKSLAALSLAHYQAISRSGSAKGLPLLAIEEPEAHLHPNAVASLVGVLSGIASTQQVVISTHNPILVRRDRLDSNIVVNKNRAKSAKSIAEIRDLLGVRVQDNMSSAELVLITEGVTDVRILTALIGNASGDLRNCIRSGRLVILGSQGAPNLPNQVALYRSLLCQVHVFADNDSAGKDAVQKCKSYGLIEDTDYHLASAIGRKESELEDLIDHRVYASGIAQLIGIEFPTKQFTRSKFKWSRRLEDELKSAGKVQDIQAIKTIVADCVEVSPENAVVAQSEELVSSVIGRLSERLLNE